ncbi:Integral membrane HPP family protein [Quillaja saponaria]|uniref:Integral membrane HPP family protein n=1 Tax=Quillaja saponaria TaxID=32244 RepID=A0AAD7LE58_QUISA|nr:Integral membrane HPP family protein [Quillaja saponaria]
MGMQMRAGTGYCHNHISSLTPAFSVRLRSFSSSTSLLFSNTHFIKHKKVLNYGTFLSERRRTRASEIRVSSDVAAPSNWDDWKPVKGTATPSLSEILWPSVGAFAAMAILGKMDQILAPKGLSMTIAPLGAVSAVLFATPTSPGARKYNMFMAQIGCAAIGVLSFSIFGPGWLARSIGLAASVAYMIYTGAIHPPAASLPILFIDGVKLQHLNFWYALFPGAAGCILLCLIQEMVVYLKSNIKF